MNARVDDLFSSLYGKIEISAKKELSSFKSGEKVSKKRKRSDMVENSCNVMFSKPANPVIESIRFKVISDIASEFERLFDTHLGTKWYKHFESWLWSGRELNSSEVSIIPNKNYLKTSEDLKRKLKASGVDGELVQELLSKMVKFCIKAKRRFDRLKVNASTNTAVKSCVIKLEDGRTKHKLRKGGVILEINEWHYEKLIKIFRNTVKTSNISQLKQLSSWKKAQIDAAIFSLLARYNSLQGAHYKNGGNQAAIHADCFQTMKEEFGVSMECFASPFNCYFTQFCSAFVDTDAPFGSVGSFFHFNPNRGGSYEANPPFDPRLISAMTLRMSKLLQNVDAALSFIVIIPYWKDKQAWLDLKNHACCREHVRILAKEHGYSEGSQHCRKNQFRQSNADSSIFFLQNDAGFKKWTPTKDKLDKLTNTFKNSLSLTTEI